MPPTAPTFAGAIPGRHLGRRSPTPEMRRKCIPLAPYVKRMGATPPPDTVDYSDRAKATLATMLGNDQYGDCTVAAALHQVGTMTAIQPGGKERVPSTQEAVNQYQHICGPGDQGCYIPDVLDAWRSSGLTCGGRAVRADGYVGCALGDQLLAKVATYLFGGLHLGVNLPRDWYTHASPGFTWDTTRSDVVGGHSIAIVGYSTAGLRVSTWGILGTLTWAAFSDPRWIEEVYAVLSPDWYSAQGLDAHGIDVASLKAALEIVRGGGDPPIPGPGPTPPPPVPPGQPGTWSGAGTLDFLGTKMPLSVQGQFAAALAGPAASSVNVWAVLMDLAQIAMAVRAKDWAGAAAAAAQLLADLGIVMTPNEQISFTNALITHYQLLPLAASGPPVG